MKCSSVPSSAYESPDYSTQLIYLNNLEHYIEGLPNNPNIENFEYDVIVFLDNIIRSFNVIRTHSIIPIITDDKNIIVKDKPNLKKEASSYSDHIYEEDEHGLLGKCFGIYGTVLEMGLFGLKKDNLSAYKFFKQSSALRYPMGTHSLARCYEFGIGTEIDYEKACYFYRLSYKLGYKKGLHRYALLLLKGNDFVEKDIPNGYNILKMAVEKADSTYPQPYYDFGMFFKARDRDVIIDKKYAFQIFLKGADLGCINCQYKVGEEYEVGDVVRKDMNQSFLWYKKSADGGLINAQIKVATIMKHYLSEKPETVESMFEDNLYLNNYFPNKNLYEISYNYALSATKAMNIDAIVFVAEAHEDGFGREVDLLKSIFWYKIAAKLDSRVAKDRLSVLYKMTGLTKANQRGTGIARYLLKLLKIL